MQQLLDDMNDALLIGLKDPSKQEIIDTAFDQMSKFVLNHGEPYDPEVDRIVGDTQFENVNYKPEILTMFMEDMNKQVNGR